MNNAEFIKLISVTKFVNKKKGLGLFTGLCNDNKSFLLSH